MEEELKKLIAAYRNNAGLYQYGANQLLNAAKRMNEISNEQRANFYKKEAGSMISKAEIFERIASDIEIALQD